MRIPRLLYLSKPINTFVSVSICNFYSSIIRDIEMNVIAEFRIESLSSRDRTARKNVFARGQFHSTLAGIMSSITPNRQSAYIHIRCNVAMRWIEYTRDVPLQYGGLRSYFRMLFTYALINVYVETTPPRNLSQPLFRYLFWLGFIACFLCV